MIILCSFRKMFTRGNVRFEYQGNVDEHLNFEERHSLALAWLRL